MNKNPVGLSKCNPRGDMEPRAVNIGKTIPDGPESEWALSQRLWLRFAFVLLGLVGLWFVPLSALARLALKSDIHSHVLLMPVVSGYVIWTERMKLPRAGGASWGLVLLFGLAALGAVAAARVFSNQALSLQILGFVLAIPAAAAAVLGRKVLQATSFAFAFLIFMVPLPGFAIEACETWLQRASAAAAEIYFKATGVAHIRDVQNPQIFKLPGLTIEVAQECSGFRSTLVLFIVSILAARLFLIAQWRRLAIVLFIIPLGILRNGFRIWVLSVLTVNVDSRIIDSPLHHQGGPIFFVLSLGPLFLLVWLLYRSERTLRLSQATTKVQLSS